MFNYCEYYYYYYCIHPSHIIRPQRRSKEIEGASRVIDATRLIAHFQIIKIGQIVLCTLIALHNKLYSD